MFSPIVFSYFEIEKYIKEDKNHSYITINMFSMSFESPFPLTINLKNNLII